MTDYEIVIIGGGIAGLYSAYQILKQSPYSNIVIYEKGHNLGGRVHTYYEKDFYLEAGAGRFHKNQQNIIQLIRELGLENKVQKTSGNSVYSDISINDKSFLFEKDEKSILFSSATRWRSV